MKSKDGHKEFSSEMSIKQFADFMAKIADEVGHDTKMMIESDGDSFVYNAVGAVEWKEGVFSQEYGNGDYVPTSRADIGARTVVKIEMVAFEALKGF